MHYQPVVARAHANEVKFLNPTATILLEQPVTIDKAGLLRALHHFHPRHCGDAIVVDEGILPPNCVHIKVAGQTVALHAFPSMLPEDQWRYSAEEACNWPNAVAGCQRHRAHVVVGIVGPTIDKLACARLTSAVAGVLAVAHLPIVLAGLWQDGITILTEGRRWAELSTQAFSQGEGFPAALWTCLLSFTEHDTQTAIILTVGLGRFAQLELEFEAPVKHQKILIEQCNNVIAYLVQNGPVLPDKASFAIPKVVHFTVFQRASERFGGIGVYAAKLVIMDGAPLDMQGRNHV